MFKTDKANIEIEFLERSIEKAEFKARIKKLKKNKTDTVIENTELRIRVVKLKQNINKLKKEL
uniref:Uncharacterized protein n=1 Tax=Rhizophagus irregularis (strain DAOM 181602 / DAOM 197198 / MUCL 43194) TaxID=747089 RepID=U9U0F9_RHIID